MYNMGWMFPMIKLNRPNESNSTEPVISSFELFF